MPTGIIHRKILGKTLYCLADQSAPDLDIAAIEKRRCNAILAKTCRFDRVLDAYAGVGVSARYWSRCAKELFLVENRPVALRLLHKNLPSIKGKNCNVRVIAGNARDFLEDVLRQNVQFDLVDCDPFGTCYDLLPMVAQLVTKGVVCVTSGEIFQVYRGLNRRAGRPDASQYRGHRASNWVVEALIPELRAIFPGSKIVHFYAYPTSVRVILALGNHPLDPQAFHRRPRFLGWLRPPKGGFVRTGPN